MSVDPAKIAYLLDRLEIQDLLTRYCKAIDTKDWSLLDTCFVPDAHVDYVSSGGVKGPYPEVRAWLAQVLPNFPMSQHTIGNFDVTIDGDRASSKVHFYNPMGRPKADGTLSLFWIGGFYVDDLVRTKDGWRIAKRIEQQAWADIR